VAADQAATSTLCNSQTAPASGGTRPSPAPAPTTWPTTWFNQSPATSGQPNGAEVMIWLNHDGSVQPFGSQVGTASIGGHSYNVCFGNQGWNTISYAMTTGTTSVDLDIGQVVADAVSRVPRLAGRGHTLAQLNWPGW
jgi:Glycosyl hydrolase family 12